MYFLYKECQACQTGLLITRVLMVLLVRGEPEDPDAGSSAYLVRRSWEEDWDDASITSFSRVLFCHRGEQAQMVLDLILNVRPRRLASPLLCSRCSRNTPSMTPEEGTSCAVWSCD